MKTRRSWLILLICYVAIGAAGAAIWLTRRPTVYVPVFVEQTCPMETSTQYTLRCGSVTVPENRAEKSNRQVILSVAIAEHPDQEAGATPVIFLNGGPGSRTLEVLPGSSLLKRVIAERPVIFFDQRGVGFSQPLLDCPESDSLLDQTLANDLDTAQINQLTFEAYESCRMRLEKEGISLAAYTTAASADDVRDIISALGYSKVYLLGLSYGTRLAQVTLLRHQDEGWIEGVILDSPVPLQVADRLSFWPNTQAAFQHIFDRCAAESDCAAHFPDLKETFIATMDALHATPLEVETFHPVTGRAITIQVNDVAFYEVFFAMLYGREKTAKIPALIQQVNQRETELLAEAFSEFFAYVQVVDEGMNLAVNCADEGYEIDLAAIEQTNATLDPVFARLAEGDAATAQRICLAWGAQPPDPAENQPLQTDLPILILAGDQDPITPAAWGELLHEAMPTSYFYEFAGVGHAVMMTFGKTGLCAETLMRTFLADSTSAPDGACVTTIQPLPFRKP